MIRPILVLFGFMAAMIPLYHFSRHSLARSTVGLNRMQGSLCISHVCLSSFQDIYFQVTKPTEKDASFLLFVDQSIDSPVLEIYLRSPAAIGEVLSCSSDKMVCKFNVSDIKHADSLAIAQPEVELSPLMQISGLQSKSPFVSHWNEMEINSVFVENMSARDTCIQIGKETLSSLVKSEKKPQITRLSRKMVQTPQSRSLKPKRVSSVEVPSTTPEPTVGPSSSPSTAPIAEPSSSPSAAPIVASTAAPTVGPSSEPSAAPIAEPSQSPSAEPVPFPSAAPSVAPSNFCEIDLVVVNFTGLADLTVEWVFMSRTQIQDANLDPTNTTQISLLGEDDVVAKGNTNFFEEEFCLEPISHFLFASVQANTAQSLLSVDSSSQSTATQCADLEFRIAGRVLLFQVCENSPFIYTVTVGNSSSQCLADQKLIFVEFSVPQTSGSFEWEIFESGLSNDEIVFGYGASQIEFCVNESVHILYINPTSSIPVDQVEYSIFLESPAVQIASGEFLNVSDPFFVLFDLDSRECKSSEYVLEALFDYGTAPSDFQVSLSLIDLDLHTSTQLALGDGRGLDLCLECGTFSVDAFSCGSDGTKFQIQSSKGVEFSEDSFSLGTSYVFDIPCADEVVSSAPTSSCSLNQSYFEMVIDFDFRPDEVEWSVINLAATTQTATVVKSGTDEDGGNVGFCLECGSDYILSVVDCGGDGICCEWGYGRYVLLQEKSTIVASGGDFAYSSREYFNVVC